MAPQPRDKVVSGAYGVGKVRIVYKPKRKPRINRIGYIIYFIFFSLIYLSYAWTVPSLRTKHVLPLIRTFSKYLDWIKIHAFSKFSPDFYAYSDQYHGEGKDNITIIVGTDLLDLMFQQGQKHAIDRMYQMDIYRHISLGTLSSIMGDQAFAIDKFSRAVNFGGLANEDVTFLDGEDKEILQAYANGINSVLLEENYAAHSIDFTISSAWWWHPIYEESKYQFKPWEPFHTMAIARLLHYQWNHDWEDELMSFLLDLKFGQTKSKVFSPPMPEKETTLSEFAKYLPSLGGNIIAVSKEFSAGNSAFLVHDLHSLNNHFGFFYANDLHSPSLSASGLSFPGIPYILIGRNEFVSWAFVPSLAKDMEDIYLLKNDSNKKIHTNIEFSTRVEIIEVYGKEQKEILEIEDTMLGPNILPFITDSLTGGLVISKHRKAMLYSASLQKKMNLRFFHSLNIAKSVDDVRVGSNFQRHANLQLVVALADGSVGHFQTGRTLPRLSNVDSKRPIVLSTQEMIDETIALHSSHKSSTVESNDDGQFIHGILFAADALSAGSLLHQYDKACTVGVRGASTLENCFRSKEGIKLSDDEVERTLLSSYSPSGEQYAKIVKRGFTLNSLNKLQEEGQNIDEFSSRSDGINNFKANIEVYNNDFILSSLSEVSNGFYPFDSVGGTIVEGFRTAFINTFTRDCGPIGSILLGMHSAGIFRSTKLQAFKAISTPDYFRDHKWLLEKHGGMDKIIVAALEETLKWIDFNFDTKQMHKLVSGNRSVSLELKPQHWTWGAVHTVTWNHPVVEISPLLDVAWSHGPTSVPGTLDSVFRSSYRSDIGLEGKDPLESKNSIVSATRVVVNMDRMGFKTIAVPASASIRPAQNFYHSNSLVKFVAPAVDLLNNNFNLCSTDSEKVNQPTSTEL